MYIRLWLVFINANGPKNVEIKKQCFSEGNEKQNTFEGSLCVEKPKTGWPATREEETNAFYETTKAQLLYGVIHVVQCNFADFKKNEEKNTLEFE